MAKNKEQDLQIHPGRDDKSLFHGWVSWLPANENHVEDELKKSYLKKGDDIFHIKFPYHLTVLLLSHHTMKCLHLKSCCQWPHGKTLVEPISCGTTERRYVELFDDHLAHLCYIYIYTWNEFWTDINQNTIHKSRYPPGNNDISHHETVKAKETQKWELGENMRSFPGGCVSPGVHTPLKLTASLPRKNDAKHRRSGSLLRPDSFCRGKRANC